MAKNSLKQYDTLVITAQYLDDAGLPIPLDGVNVTAHLNTKNGDLIEKLKVNIIDTTQGVFTCQPTLKQLPVGTLSADINLEKHGIRVTSDTISINVVKAETNPYLV